MVVALYTLLWCHGRELKIHTEALVLTELCTSAISLSLLLSLKLELKNSLLLYHV